MKNTIEVGDIVNVYFGNERFMPKCKVLYVPCAPGDSWHLRRITGDLVYVQQFEIMIKDSK